MIVAHVFGLPVEEAIPQLVPAWVAASVLLRLTLERTPCWTIRFRRADRRRDSGDDRG